VRSVNLVISVAFNFGVKYVLHSLPLQICVWCWHHIMEMAEKDRRCPACREPYNKEKIVGMSVSCDSSVCPFLLQCLQIFVVCYPASIVLSSILLFSVPILVAVPANFCGLLPCIYSLELLDSVSGFLLLLLFVISSLYC